MTVRVCLIIPPSPFLLDERVFPSLGVLRVATSLERSGHEVDVLDLSGVKDTKNEVARRFFNESPDVIGITATTPQMPGVVPIVAAIRDAAPGLRIVLGGPHATMTHAACRGGKPRADGAMKTLERLFDTIVAGDGEYAIHEAIMPDAPKWIDADNRKSPLFMADGDDALPARHLIDLESYRYKIDGHKSTSFVGQLGCPFSCKFCGGRNSPSFRIARKRSVQSVVNEIEMMYETYGYTGFMAYDDELNVNKELVKLMKELRRLQDELKVEFAFRGFVKSELFTAEQAEAMYDAGFRWLLCGFEAADDRILSNIKKRATLEDNTRMIDTARKAGIKVKALMSIGHPGEDHSTVGSIKDWLIEKKADDFDCTIITPYPGTPYYDDAVQCRDGTWRYTADNGDNLYQIALDYEKTADYYKGIPGDYRSYVFTDALGQDDLVRMRDDLENTVRSTLNLPFAFKPLERTMGQ